MPKSYPQIILGLLVIGALASLVFNLWQLLAVAQSEDTTGLIPGIITSFLVLGILFVAIKAFRAGQSGRGWVKWYLWILTIMGVAIFLANIMRAVEGAQDLRLVAYPFAIILLAAAAWTYESSPQ